ncbi:site-2 protease family protein [Effusibacillus consociatus]|uniref:Site-2 protease family protein n=1 Tax=Effusibacillus consociatus TaxID=1117041 RepID=A0ABV9PUX3_9BACL
MVLFFAEESDGRRGIGENMVYFWKRYAFVRVKNEGRGIRSVEKRRRSNKWKTIGGLGTLLAAFGGKLKFLIPLLKFGKVGGTIWSMALMVGAYALIYPWTFALGIAIMLLIHEMGHVIAARRKGLPVSAPAFIPFLGAMITMKKQPADAETEAYIAYGGPLIGTVGAVLVLGAAMATDYTPLYAVAQIGFFLNLINLLPIHPLDGGRIVTAISRWLWGVGLIGGLVVILYLKAILFLLIWALFAWELYKGYVRKKKPGREATIHRELPVNRQIFEELGGIVPGEAHRRELPFVQYCRLEDKQHLCTVFYPGVGRITDYPFEQGHIHKIELYMTTWQGDQGKLHIKITYDPYPEYRYETIREEEYYQVSSRTRITYGVAYFGLAAVLGWLMYFTAVSIPVPPVAG